MAKETSLKICKANIELMIEREQLDIIEPAIRRGVTSVYEERHFVANNNFSSDYRPSEESIFALCVDANNLYGVVMQMEQLPVAEFSFHVEINLNENLSTLTTLQVFIFLK